MTVHLFSLQTGKNVAVYTFSVKFAVVAVVAAYAQSKGDWNTADYNDNYAHLVVETRKSIACGDFYALK